MRDRDDEIQDALDAGTARAAADADEAAYRVVFAALREDDGFGRGLCRCHGRPADARPRGRVAL